MIAQLMSTSLTGPRVVSGANSTSIRMRRAATEHARCWHLPTTHVWPPHQQTATVLSQLLKPLALARCML